MPRILTPPPETDTDTDNAPTEKLGTFAIVALMYGIHTLMLQQQAKDNGVRPWLSVTRIANALLDATEGRVKSALRAMRDDFRMPLDYVEKRKGWGYLEPVTQFPLLVYSSGESMALCVAMRGTSMYAGTPFAKQARLVVKKLTAGLRGQVAVEFEALERVVSFHCTGADAFIPPQTFDLVTPALIRHHELEIDYAAASRITKLDGASDSEAGIRRVEPLHLACIDFGWYLFAYDLLRKEIRTFALRRIKALRLTGRIFEPRRFNVKKELAHSFGPFLSGKAENIRLRFWGHAATVIPEFIWHSSQCIQPVADAAGKIDVTLNVAVNPRFVGWIKEWLGEVAVLEPKSLRERVSFEARRGADLQDSEGAEYDRRKSAANDA
jgi:predicted DNA-binding transcriptional regulator YafY